MVIVTLVQTLIRVTQSCIAATMVHAVLPVCFLMSSVMVNLTLSTIWSDGPQIACLPRARREKEGLWLILVRSQIELAAKRIEGDIFLARSCARQGEDANDDIKHHFIIVEKKLPKWYLNTDKIYKNNHHDFYNIDYICVINFFKTE